MKKEVIIAIFIGVVIGLIITFGLKRAEQSLNAGLESPQAQSQTNNLEVAETPDHTLYVASPQPNSIVESDKITISGSTTPYSLLAVISDHDQNTTMADTQGNFSVSLSVLKGANLISVKSYDNLGKLANLTFPIVYTDIDFDQITPIATPTATPKLRKTPTPKL